MKPKLHLPLQIRQRGFSLTEILVGMTAGLLLTAGVIQVFVSSKQGYRVQEALSRLQENGRFAMEFISQDARNTGFLGCGGSTSRFANRLKNANQYVWNFSVAVQGFEAISASTWAPNPPNIKNLLNYKNLGSRDVLTLRHSLGNPARVINHSASSGPLRISANNDLNQFDIAMVSDCIDTAIFEITEISSGKDTDADGQTIKINDLKYTKNLEKRYTNKATVTQITTSTYYIRTSPGGAPSLYRKRGVDPSRELIEGVEDMQILYGEDTDGNQEANSYVTADNVSNWNNVINLRISLLLQTLEDNLTSSSQPYTFNGVTTTPTDRRLRRVFTTTLNLRNKAL